MYSPKSGALEGALQNPNVLAMLGSAGIHGGLVLLAALNPAESQPRPLQIVNLAPSPTANSQGANLAVPNGLPPINLGDIPTLGPLPDASAFGLPPSQSFYVGSNPASINLGNLRTRDVPKQSFPGTQIPVYNVPNIPNSIVGGTVPLSAPTPLPNRSSIGQFQQPTRLNPTHSDYSVAQTPALPQLSSEQFQNSDLVNLYAKSSPNPASANIPENQTVASSPTSLSPEVRSSFKTWLEAQSQQRGQALSAQSGPRLIAAYPPEACTSQQQGAAVISAVYSPDGTLSSGDGAIKILSSAPSLVLNQAAIAAVAGYRPPIVGIYQAFNFTVDIPYSEAVCQSASPTSSPTALPQPSPSPTAKPAQLPEPEVTSQPKKPQPKPAASPLRKPAPTPSTESATPTNEPLILPKPEASSSSSPTVVETPTPLLGPLPAPSIALPEASP